jgi:tRNA (cytosine49-C5)-methyltransferase
MNLPEKFLERLKEQIPDETKRHAVVETFCHKRPLTIRCNTLVTTKQNLEAIFYKHQIVLEPVIWYTNAYIVKNATTEQLTSLPIYKEGYFYIQNLASMLPALVLDPQPGEHILDMCAAPGSKTTQIAMMMQNKGEIIANDKSRQRLFKLNALCKQYGINNVQTKNLPGEIMWKKYPNYFDKILVDAPCTMEGRFFASDPDTYIDWTPKKVKILSHMQKWLLRSAVTATKPGGTIIYSTCTLAPEENEEVIDWILKIEHYPLTIAPIHIPQLKLERALSTWKQKTFADQVVNSTRILPTQTMEGFFIAKIIKGNF